MITRRDSFLPPLKSRAGPTADPRPVKSKQYQSTARMRLKEYCTNNKINITSMDKPTSSDFQTLFAAMYREVDPWYRPCEMGMGSFHDELGYIMRTVLKYPFEASISKSAILTATASNHWVNFVAFLDWLLDLVTLARNMKMSALDDLDSTKAFKTRIEMYKEASVEGTTEQDVFDNIKDKFREERKNLQAQILDRQDKIDKLQAQIDELKQTPSPLLKLHAEREVVEAELDRAKAELRDVELRHNLNRTTLNDTQRDLADQLAQLRQLEQTSTQLDQRLASQEISMTEAQQMAETRQKLLEDMSEYDNRTRGENEAMYVDESAHREAKKRAKDAVDQFRAWARKLNFVPTATSELAARFGVDFERVVPYHGLARPLDEVSAAQPRAQVWQALAQFRVWIQEEMMAKKSDLAIVQQAVEESEAHVRRLQAELSALKSTKGRIDKERQRVQTELDQLRVRMQAELDEQQRDMGVMRAAADKALFEAQDKVAKKRKEWKKTEADLNDEAQAAASELVAMVESMVHLPEVMDAALGELDADMEASIAELSQYLATAVDETGTIEPEDGAETDDSGHYGRSDP